MALELGRGALRGPPQRLFATIQGLTDAGNWLPPADALPGLNCIHDNELGPWTPGWLI